MRVIHLSPMDLPQQCKAGFFFDVSLNRPLKQSSCRWFWDAMILISHHCNVHLFSSPTPRIVWGTTINGRHQKRAYNTEYVIWNVKMEDEGNYTCRGRNKPHGKTAYSEYVRISVDVQSTFLSSLHLKHSYLMSASASLSSTAPPPCNRNITFIHQAGMPTKACKLTLISCDCDAKSWRISVDSAMHSIMVMHGPFTRYVKLQVVHAAGMPGTFSPPPTSKESTS